MSETSQKQAFIQNSILLLSDFFCICLSYGLAILTRGITADVARNTQYYLLILFFAVILCLLSYLLLNWNVGFFRRGMLAEFFFVVKYDFVLGCGLGVFMFLTQKAQDFSRLAFLYFICYNVVFTFLFHLMVKQFLTKVYRKSDSSSKMMIISTCKHLSELIPQLKNATEWSHEITSLALLDEDCVGQTLLGIPVTASASTLFDVINKQVLDEVFVFLPEYSNHELGRIIEQFEFAGITVHVNIDPFDHLISHTSEDFAGFTVLSYSVSSFDFHRLMIKRIMDILGSIVGLFITILCFPFIAIAIKLDSPGPVFYRQIRIGRNGREFTLYKFRSMYLDADYRKKELLDRNEMDGPMFKITNDPRITRVGSFLRKTSLDELPQFYNILMGNMSLVGTRPPTKDEYSQYNPYYRRRLSIKPGLTGLWQVSGRSEIQQFEEVVKLDLRYIDNWSLGLDVKILLQTLGVLFNRRGAK